jgi:hypothetical protein
MDTETVIALRTKEIILTKKLKEVFDQLKEPLGKAERKKLRTEIGELLDHDWLLLQKEVEETI